MIQNKPANLTSASKKSNEHSGHILIVDDEKKNRIFMKDILEVKGYHVSEAEDGDWRLTGRENLRFFAALRNISPSEFPKRLNAIEKVLRLGDFIDRRFDSCSSGMKQRLAVARGLLHNPKILFLDEPTNNLDPIAAAALREIIKRLTRDEGRTVILVTHQLREAEELCDRIAIMHKGRLRVIESEDVSLEEMFTKYAED